MNDRDVPGFVRLRQPIDRLLRHLKSPPARDVRRLVDRWADVVGPKVAAHTTVVSLRDEVLIVRVDDAAWANELRWLEADIRHRLNALEGSSPVRLITFRVRLENDR